MCRAYAKKFYDLLGDAVYDEDVAGLEETLVRTLKEKGLTLSTAESCTCLLYTSYDKTALPV